MQSLKRKRVTWTSRRKKQKVGNSYWDWLPAEIQKLILEYREGQDKKDHRDKYVWVMFQLEANTQWLKRDVDKWLYDRHPHEEDLYILKLRSKTDPMILQGRYQICLKNQKVTGYAYHCGFHLCKCVKPK